MTTVPAFASLQLATMPDCDTTAAAAETAHHQLGARTVIMTAMGSTSAPATAQPIPAIGETGSPSSSRPNP